MAPALYDSTGARHNLSIRLGIYGEDYGDAFFLPTNVNQPKLSLPPNNLHAYPNPSRGIINIDGLKNSGPATSVQLFDATGRLVGEFSGQQIDVQVAPGTYLIRAPGNTATPITIIPARK